MPNENVTPDNDNTSGQDDLGNDPSNELDALLASITSIDAGDDNEGEVEVKGAQGKAVDKVEEKKVEPEASTKDTTTADNDRGLERLSKKEKEVREAREAFDKEKGQYVKHGDLALNPTAVLQKIGIDPDVLMKTILFEKLPDSNPLKAKLKVELSDVATKKEIAKLREEMESRDRRSKDEQENHRVFQETVARLDKYVDVLRGDDNKTLPTLSRLGKKDAGHLKELVLNEMISDAKDRFVRGEDGDPISHEEAANRVEKFLAKLAPLFSTDTATTLNKGSDNSKAKKRSIVPGAANAKGAQTKTPQEELDDLIANALR